MKPEIRAQLAALGPEITLAMVQETNALMAGLAAARDPQVDIQRDVQYGPDPRNRLDIHRKGHPSRAPVLVYVHGGGYVMGDKTTPGLPFFDNIGQWAAARGWIGVTMTYRLAPAHRWPSGPEDMALAVAWLREHIGASGGDPDAIFLMGQSAGGAHVSAYVAQQRFHPDGATSIAGALMISGIYDPSTQPSNPFNDAYFGEGTAARTEARSIEGLVASTTPLLFTVSELDPRDFQSQAMQLVTAWHQHKHEYPPMNFLAGHNHLSPALSIGSAEDQLARCIERFVAVVTSR
jgi:triacylglycerol lipase